MNTKLFEFKWTVSKGQNTYGYNICTLYINGKKVSSCNGGGYDMEGTALAEWMNKTFNKELCTIATKERNEGWTKDSYYNDSSGGFYGLYTSVFTNKGKKEISTHCNGGCGFSAMDSILKEIGYDLEYKGEGKNKTNYILIKKELEVSNI